MSLWAQATWHLVTSVPSDRPPDSSCGQTDNSYINHHTQHKTDTHTCIHLQDVDDYSSDTAQSRSIRKKKGMSVIANNLYGCQSHCRISILSCRAMHVLLFYLSFQTVPSLVWGEYKLGPNYMLLNSYFLDPQMFNHNSEIIFNHHQKSDLKLWARHLFLVPFSI